MSMQDRLNQRAEAADAIQWKDPKIGEMIEGKLIDRYTIHHEVFEPADIIVLDTQPRPTSVLCSTASLRRELTKWDPQIGEHVGIMYKGTKDSGAGKAPTKIYLMEVERQAAIPAGVEFEDDGAEAPF